MITIGFSSHRAEALPFVRQHMDRHRIIVLEEPPSPHFSAMLEGRVSINGYIMELDVEFPEFERLMCGLLRELHSKGRRITQVEPYLETLLQIHELFAEGKTPEYVVKDPSLKEVYKAEKRVAGALITYYTRSIQASFEDVVDAVKDFARTDARRIALRERLRAQAIAPLTRSGESVYVEAGYIHYLLYRYLRRELGPAQKIRVVFLLEPIVRKLKGRRRNLGPGDVLTLHYVFHNALQNGVADLLAARSLIYIKLIQKEELLPGLSDAPHTEDEVRVNRLVDRLRFDDCKTLFDLIRLAKRKHALQLVKAYLEQKNPI